MEYNLKLLEGSNVSSQLVTAGRIHYFRRSEFNIASHIVKVLDNLMTKTNISNYEVITSFAAGQNFIGCGEQS